MEFSSPHIPTALEWNNSHRRQPQPEIEPPPRLFTKQIFSLGRPKRMSVSTQRSAIRRSSDINYFPASRGARRWRGAKHKEQIFRASRRAGLRLSLRHPLCFIEEGGSRSLSRLKLATRPTRGRYWTISLGTSHGFRLSRLEKSCFRISLRIAGCSIARALVAFLVGLRSQSFRNSNLLQFRRL